MCFRFRTTPEVGIADREPEMSLGRRLAWGPSSCVELPASRGHLAAVSGCSIPSGRDCFTPSLTCYGHGCTEFDATEDSVGPSAANHLTRRSSTPLHTPVSSKLLIAEDSQKNQYVRIRTIDMRLNFALKTGNRRQDIEVHSTQYTPCQCC